MSIRKTVFANGEFYHVYNRGTDKRNIFGDERDQSRFLQGMVEFNAVNPIGSIYACSFNKKSEKLSGKATKSVSGEGSEEKLVEIVAYCLNPNHYHFILKQISDRGVEKYMHRIGTGYTRYFNNKNERSGSLFQGKFKAIHIDSNEYLLHVSAYVNLNDRVHHLDELSGLATKSSWREYMNGGDFCEKESILGQFREAKEYADFAMNSLCGILERRSGFECPKEFFIED